MTQRKYNKQPNPISKEKIRCSQCNNFAIMLRDKISYCKLHAPYLRIQMKGGKKNE